MTDGTGPPGPAGPAPPVGGGAGSGGAPPAPPGGSSSGGQPPDHRQAAKDFLDQALARHANLPAARQQEYRAAAHAVFDQMTQAGLERLNRHLTGYRLFPDLVELNQYLRPGAPRQQIVLAVRLNAAATGGYNATTGELEADGGWVIGSRVFSTQYVFAHESTHAVDGPQGEISGTPEWQNAWRAEVVPAFPGTRAARGPGEGFARFGQVVYESGLSRQALEARYPLAVDVWRRWGLW
jgi:hypothetical protein